MAKQVLSIEQMQHLQELGLDTSNASSFWCNPDRHGDWALEFTDSCGGKIPQSNEYDEFYPAYTLQDVLDALPLQIEIPLHPEMGKYELRIKRFIFDKRKVMYAVLYEKEDYIDWFVMQSYESVIDSAYELLVWCIENKFVETNKNK